MKATIDLPTDPIVTVTMRESQARTLIPFLERAHVTVGIPNSGDYANELADALGSVVR